MAKKSWMDNGHLMSFGYEPIRIFVNDPKAPKGPPRVTRQDKSDPHGRISASNYVVSINQRSRCLRLPPPGSRAAPSAPSRHSTRGRHHLVQALRTKPSLTNVPFREEVANPKPPFTKSQPPGSEVENLNRQMKNV